MIRNKLTRSFLLFALLRTVPAGASTVEELLILSSKMDKPIPATLILPDAYRDSTNRFPVVYLLHGAGGNHQSWNAASDVAVLADEYEIIILCPDGGKTSWYFDSPVDPAFQYESFVSEDCVAFMDQNYRTLASRNHRALCGLSMGGHGALFLAIRHRDVFGIAVSLSGGVDIRPFPENWDIKERIGSMDVYPENWEIHTVINLAKELKDGDLAIALDCGDQDFFLGVNRALHAQFQDRDIEHVYIEKPGAHTWDYWKEAIRRQMPFIQEQFNSSETAGRFGPPPGSSAIGASMNWETYPAEEGNSNAAVHGPSREHGTPAAEAVGRKYVRLAAEGEFVDFIVTQPANSLVMRYCIPDAPKGGGTDATLSLYINGKFEKKLKLTSRYAWNYGDYPWTNNPKDGKAHHFFDEMNAFIPGVAEGDVVRLQKGDSDSADYYLLDFIELEQVGPPLSRPDNSLSIADFNTLKECIAVAKQEGKTVWVPPGNHRVHGPRLQVGGVSVQGAGMWYSRLIGSGAMFEGTGEPVNFSDLAIFGEITHRDNDSPDNAFNGNLGDGSRFSNLWIEHVKCGFWTTQGTQRLELKDSRIRNVMADGLNFCDGTSHSTVKNCHLRNSGDDALASWSPMGDWSSKKPCIENRFLNNTIQQPWLANGIAVYGGTDHLIEGNDIRETVISGAGILVSSGFEAVPFAGTIQVKNNRISGAGGDCYIGDTIGGLWLYAKDSNVEAVVEIEGLTIHDSKNSSISIHGPKRFSNLRIKDVESRGFSEYALHVKPGGGGHVYLEGSPRIEHIKNDSADATSIITTMSK